MNSMPLSGRIYDAERIGLPKVEIEILLTKDIHTGNGSVIIMSSGRNSR